MQTLEKVETLTLSSIELAIVSRCLYLVCSSVVASEIIQQDN